MICNDCTASTLNVCCTTLIVGTTPNPANTYLLRVYDITNSRLTLLPTTNVGGMLHVDMEGIRFACNHAYEVTLVAATDIDTAVAFACGMATIECVQATFVTYYNGDGSVLIDTTQYLVQC